MYTIEFETNITSKYIELKDYKPLLNKHVKVIISVDDVNTQTEDRVIKQLQELDEIIQQRSNLPKVSEAIDIDALCNEVNRDIF